MAENKVTNQNSYRVGDWVYCETSPNLPYCIRKIEELVKAQNGNLEARVICAFRRRDISLSLLTTLDKNPFYMITQFNSNSDIDDDLCNTIANSNNPNEQQIDEINDLQKYQLKHRELFYSKYTEQIQVSLIRGKCNVHLYSSDLDSYTYYLNNEDTFYYQLTYDPNQKKLLSDEGKIRVGLKYQAEIPALTKQTDDIVRDELIWDCNDFKLNDDDFKKYTLIAQSIGTYARALDYNNNSSNPVPNILLSAVNASRDITLFNSHKLLHESKYSLTKALLNFIPSNGNGPVLCKDEIENWSSYEMDLFEEGLDKYGKNFFEIRKELLPWKSLNSIVEYYYLWKTSDRYVPKKRNKEAQGRKLGVIYIPSYQKQHQAQIPVKDNRTITCESCSTTQSTNWFLANIAQESRTTQYQSSTQYLQSYNQSIVYSSNQQQQQQTTQQPQQQQQFQPARLCAQCWIYWKKYGSFKYMGQKGDTERPGPDRRLERINAVRAQIHKCEIELCGKEFKLRTQLAKHYLIAHAIALRSGGPKPILKGLKSFYLNPTPLTKATRLLFLKFRHYAIHPFRSVDFIKLKSEWFEEIRNIREILDTHKKEIKEKQNKKKKTIFEIFRLDDPKRQYKNINTNPILKIFNLKGNSYKPERINFPKPSDEIIAKFFQNLHNQSRKRNHDNIHTADTASDDSCTSVKRILLNTINKSSISNNTNNETNNNYNAGRSNKKQTAEINNFNLQQSLVANFYQLSKESRVGFKTLRNIASVMFGRVDSKVFFMRVDNCLREYRKGVLNELSYDFYKLAKNPFRNDENLISKLESSILDPETSKSFHELFETDKKNSEKETEQKQCKHKKSLSEIVDSIRRRTKNLNTNPVLKSLNFKGNSYQVQRINFAKPPNETIKRFFERLQACKCDIERCRKKCRTREDLNKHYIITHGIIPIHASKNKRIHLNNLDDRLYLNPNPITKLLRFNMRDLKYYARHPFKTIKLSETDQKFLMIPRQISRVLEARQRQRKSLRTKKRKSIDQIFKLSRMYKNICMETEMFFKSSKPYMPKLIRYPKPSNEKMNDFFQNIWNERHRSGETDRNDSFIIIHSYNPNTKSHQPKAVFLNQKIKSKSLNGSKINSFTLNNIGSVICASDENKVFYMYADKIVKKERRKILLESFSDYKKLKKLKMSDCDKFFNKLKAKILCTSNN